MALDRWSLRNIVVINLLAAVTLAPACLQDRDTLSKEALGHLDVVDTIVGRFDRNPPLYFEMRLARVSKEIKTNSKQFELYDDAAVACDRLGRDDEAIQWIEQKKSQMAPLDMHDSKSVFRWYRYYANCGTFWAHRWIGHGGSPEKLNDLQHARDLIAQAIKVNPEAHGGREGYQLMTMNWLIDVKEGKSDIYGLGDYIEERLRKDSVRPIQMETGPETPEYAEAVKGLCGLIQLGAAWRSIDTYLALDYILQMKDANVGHLAGLRAVELFKDGGVSMLPDFNKELPEMAPYIDSMIMPMARYQRNPKIDQMYAKLRANADAWEANRNAFMLAKLKAGKHPDTDPDFWQGYVEVPRVDIDPEGTQKRNWWIVGVVIFVVTVGAWILFRRRARRNLAR